MSAHPMNILAGSGVMQGTWFRFGLCPEAGLRELVALLQPESLWGIAACNSSLAGLAGRCYD